MPPLEILRQYMQYSFWYAAPNPNTSTLTLLLTLRLTLTLTLTLPRYDLKKQTPKYVKGCQIVGVMGHPGGGRNVISPRTLHCFHLLNMTFPSESQAISN